MNKEKEKNRRHFKNICIFADALEKQWSVRLGVRTPGFHPGNRGSIPLRTTKNLDLIKT